jgi:hypothetical protein
MPDDNYRPTHGHPPESRPTNVPPEWWSQLERTDLPAGGGELDEGRRHRRRRDADVLRALNGPPPGLRWQRWGTNVGLIVIAVLLLTAGLGGPATTGMATVLIVLGILTLAVAVGVQLVTGAHRRR